MAPEERAHEGVFLGFQYPVEIPGVNNVYLLKAALNAARKHRGLPEVDAFEFLTLVREKMKLMKMDESFLSRGVNEGFSGGEKKRNEILQMLVLEPKLAVLDETDSGLDIDALKVVSNGVNTLRSPDGRWCWSPTISGCWTMWCLITYMCWCAAGLPAAAIRPWRWSSKSAATTGSSKRRPDERLRRLHRKLAATPASPLTRTNRC